MSQINRISVSIFVLICFVMNQIFFITPVQASVSSKIISEVAVSIPFQIDLPPGEIDRITVGEGRGGAAVAQEKLVSFRYSDRPAPRLLLGAFPLSLL